MNGNFKNVVLPKIVGLFPDQVLLKPIITYNNKDHGQDQPTDTSIPDQFNMYQNYPNPFNVTTTIYYTLKEDVKVRLIIYSNIGQVVQTLVNETQPAGYHSVIWDGKNSRGESVPSGIYIYKVSAGKFKKSLKLLMLK